jgi:hypothetical protein
MAIEEARLQHAFKHAKDFGIEGPRNKQTLSGFAAKIEAHIAAPDTRVINGSYRGKEVRHFLNDSTRLNVILDMDGHFLSGWKLSLQQLRHVLTTGKLGGGR